MTRIPYAHSLAQFLELQPKGPRRPARAAQEACDAFGPSLRNACGAVILLGDPEPHAATGTELFDVLAVVREHNDIWIGAHCATPCTATTWTHVSRTAPGCP